MITATLSQERQRFRDFEMITEGIDALFANPDIARVVAPLGVDFEALNERAFMPNIRHGKLYIPMDRRDSDDVAIVPTFAGEARTGFAYTDSALGVTSTQRDVINQALQEDGQSPLPTDRVLAWRAKNFQPRTSSLVGYAAAKVVRLDVGDLLFCTRPIMFASQALLKHHVSSVPAVTAHEYTHINDFTRKGVAPKQLRLHFAAHTELRAYYASKGIQGVLGISDYFAGVSRMVDQMRQAANLEFPFELEDIPRNLVGKMRLRDII